MSRNTISVCLWHVTILWALEAEWILELESPCTLGDWCYIKNKNHWGILFAFTSSCLMVLRPGRGFIFQMLIFKHHGAEALGLLFHLLFPQLNICVVFSDHFVLLGWWHELSHSVFRQRGFSSRTLSSMCILSYSFGSAVSYLNLYFVQHSSWFLHSRYSFLFNEGSNLSVSKITCFLVLSILWLKFQVILDIFISSLLTWNSPPLEAFPTLSLKIFTCVLEEIFSIFLLCLWLYCRRPLWNGGLTTDTSPGAKGVGVLLSLGCFSRNNFP